MKNWTIGNRITFGFAALLVIIIGLVAFTSTQVAKIEHQSARLNSASIPALGHLVTAQYMAGQNNALLYKHIYSPDEADMQNLESAIGKNALRFNEAIVAYENLQLSTLARETLNRTKENVGKMRDLRTQILSASRTATTPQESAKVCAQARSQYDPLSTDFLDTLEKLMALERDQASTNSVSMYSAAHSTKIGMLVVASLAFVFTISLGSIIIRSTNRALRRLSTILTEASTQVTAASRQVSGASQSLAEGSSNQAASLEETSSSLEEISSMTKRNAENAENARKLAGDTRQSTEQGTHQMHEMVIAMGEIKTSSNNIAKIIKTIDEIAFQTNILALNAAVEAARAGEAGAGFAVVAEEVRNLAQRSAVAARETAESIEDSISKSARGTSLSSQVAEGLSQVAEKARRMDVVINEISTASKEQDQGLGQISTAVAQMNTVTQANAANAEETASASEELNAQAVSLLQIVEELQKLVGGARTH